jgi:phosphoglucosamine mutase
VRPAEAPRPGRVADRSAEAREQYVRRLVEVPRRPGRLRGRTVALDLANGATYAVAPEVFRRLGMQVVAMGASPDGLNINRGCGALHPEGLAKLVLDSRADVGFCFDGDGDRMIPVTRSGAVLDGDHVLYLAGKHFGRAGRLREPLVVATSMSNVGLEVALRAEGLGLLRTDVGDRNVYLAMVERRLPVGGEQSGHIIFLEDALTGDGILAALKLLDLLEGDALDLDGETAPMRRYPQLLRNVRVPEKVPFERLPLVGEAVKAAEARLDGEGRVVLRYSGTEPLARVMIEGPDQSTVEALVKSVCDAIRESLPGSV